MIQTNVSSFNATPVWQLTGYAPRTLDHTVRRHHLLDDSQPYDAPLRDWDLQLLVDPLVLLEQAANRYTKYAESTQQTDRRRLIAIVHYKSAIGERAYNNRILRGHRAKYILEEGGCEVGFEYTVISMWPLRCREYCRVCYNVRRC